MIASRLFTRHPHSYISRIHTFYTLGQTRFLRATIDTATAKHRQFFSRVHLLVPSPTGPPSFATLAGEDKLHPEALELGIKGVVAGLAISAPVGPVNVLCVSRTLAGGRVAGLVSGLGAAAADTIYGAIAGFSISFIIEFLIRQESRIRLGGGILLIGIGILYFRKKPLSLQEQRRTSGHSTFATAFLLNLTNPTTVLSFLAVLAGLGLSQKAALWLNCVLVSGIFVGAMLWWTILALLTNHFRERFHQRAMRWMNRIAGIAIGGFGIVTIILSFS
jgi:threonine/homoserine/homoserine lactone efflux protein